MCILPINLWEDFQQERVKETFEVFIKDGAAFLALAN